MNDLRGADADEVARRSAAAMFERDTAARTMGIELLDIALGHARVAFVVRPEMLNGHASCHGGYVFALADTAFAYACNTRNEMNVALQASISFVAPGRSGERLIASARERSRGGRTGLYDVEVSGPGGEPIAFFRGTSYRLNATVI